jgi:hypothetical protein
MNAIGIQSRSTFPAAGAAGTRPFPYRVCWRLILATTVASAMVPSLVAQDILVSTPFGTLSDSYYERIGVNWGFSFGGPSSRVFGFFNQDSSSSAIPPFGGYDPNADATFGFQTDNFSLGLRMGKGSTRTMTSAVPSVVVPNGGFGSIFDGSVRPFVTGVVPVVGNPGDIVEPYVPPPPQAPPRGKSWSSILKSGREERPFQPTEALANYEAPSNSSAASGDLSVAAIKAQRAADLQAQQDQLSELVAQADSAEQSGEYSRARSALRKAVKMATGQRRYDLQRRLEGLQDK